jgi:UDP-N-acetylglucosamine--N-acetylmuramyl-(pentapeptide) pyrophosphoryl-undecaprenol N-acetylglucosamine transferase
MTKKENIKIVFACGGTGGHIYPAVALAQECSAPCLFIGGNDRSDKEIITKYGFRFFGLNVSRKISINLFRSIIKARKVLKAVYPKLLVSTGGYTTVPVIIAAFSLRIPIFLLEQNTIPGQVNRYLQSFSKKIFVSFPETKSYFKKNKTIISGNPVRKSFIEDDTYKAFKKINFRNESTILIFGGSQGSKIINDLINKNHDYFLNSPYTLIHITGENFYKNHFLDEPFTIINNQKDQPKIFILPYTESIDYLYSLSDLVISRAGATTIAELVYFKKPSLLIPFPGAKDNHQLQNAISCKKLVNSEYLTEDKLNIENLITKISLCFEKKPPINLGTDNARSIISKNIQKFL